MSADPWTNFPPRQITGKPTRYYGYIGRERREEHCCESGNPPGTHRYPRLAVNCARRAAKKRNEAEELELDQRYDPHDHNGCSECIQDGIGRSRP